MPIRGSPNGAYHPHPQAGRDRPEWVVAINRNAWSQSIGIVGRDHPVRARYLPLAVNHRKQHDHPVGLVTEKSTTCERHCTSP